MDYGSLQVGPRDTFQPMIRRPRMVRWLAALLLIASPAFGGQLLAVAHPCPVAAAIPVSAQPADAEAADHQHHDTDQGAQDHSGPEHGDCACIGTCQAALGQLASPNPVVIAVVTPQVAAAPLGGSYAAPPIGVPLDRLPPKTAPPRD